MSDVRLVGTNPDDGSLVPVSVTSAGLLRTAIGKIESIPNDVRIEGDLTVTGAINGETGGGLDLPPNPSPGQVLGWENGELAWVDQPDVPTDLVGLPTPFGADGSSLMIQDSQPAWVLGEQPPPSNIVWSDYLSFTAEGAYFLEDKPASLAFDGNTSTAGAAGLFGGELVFNPPYNLGTIHSFRIWFGSGTPTVTLDFKGVPQTVDTIGQWAVCSRYIGMDWSSNAALRMKLPDGSSAAFYWNAIEINGEILTNTVVVKVDQLRALEERLLALEKGLD